MWHIGKAHKAYAAKANLAKEPQFLAHPPIKNSLNITGLKGGESIKMCGVAGKIIHQLKSTGTIIVIPFDKLNEGIHHINIMATNGSTSSFKVVKNKYDINTELRN